MSNNLFSYYNYALGLKELLYTNNGSFVKNGDRNESVAEHGFGCLLLSLINSQKYNYEKLAKLIVVQELQKAMLAPTYYWETMNPEDKQGMGKFTINKITEGLANQQEFMDLLNELNESKSAEAIYAKTLDIIEPTFGGNIFFDEGAKLKSVIRTGWPEVKIKGRLESVAEHAFGCAALVMGLGEEFTRDLDMGKVFKIIVLKELEKTVLKELSTRDTETPNDRKDVATEVFNNISDNLTNKQELIDLFNDYYSYKSGIPSEMEKASEEAKLVYHIGKFESDIAAKKYDIEGRFTLENALEDVKQFQEPERSEILPLVKRASDGWLIIDSRDYTLRPFQELSKDLLKAKSLHKFNKNNK